MNNVHDALFWLLAKQRRADSSGGAEPKDANDDEDLEMDGEGSAEVEAHKSSADAHKASAKAYASGDEAAHKAAAEKHAVAFSKHTMAGDDAQAKQHLDAMKQHHEECA